MSSSSSAVTPGGSSSSAQPASSSSVVIGRVDTYNVKVSLPIDDNYTPVTVNFDVAEVAAKLGLSASTISLATFFAQESDGTVVTKSTAKEPGHWFGKDGSVVEWGENAYVFSEADVSKGTLSIGHYPNRVNNGETYSFTQGLSYSGKQVLFKVSVTLTNGKDGAEIVVEKSSSSTASSSAEVAASSSAGVAASSSSSGANVSSSSAVTSGMAVLMDGLNGPARNMGVSYRHGMITVQYSLPQRDNVKISLFTGYGALVAQKITGRLNAGVHTYSFDLAGLPAGMYIVKVSSGSYREARPISITR